MIFPIRDVCSLIVTTNKGKYSNLARKLEITKGLLESAIDKEVVINIPMIKEPKDDDDSQKAFAVLSYAGVNKKVQLKALSCMKKEIEVKTFEKNDLQVCKFKTEEMEGNQLFDFSNTKKEVKERNREDKNPSIRFVVQIDDSDLLKTEPKNFDTRFKNTLQDFNMQLSLIYRDNSEEGNGEYVMRTFDAPSYVTKETPVWDICFFSSPFIIETNVMLGALPATADSYFDYYTKLNIFLKNRKSYNFTEILGKFLLVIYFCLGFDIEGVYRTDDTWLDPAVFENAFSNELIGTDS